MSAGQSSALRAIGASAPILPKLFILIFLTPFCTDWHHAGGRSRNLVAILLALAPVMLVQDKMGIFASMRSSMRLTWADIASGGTRSTELVAGKNTVAAFASSFAALTPEIGAYWRTP